MGFAVAPGFEEDELARSVPLSHTRNAPAAPSAPMVPQATRPLPPPSTPTGAARQVGRSQVMPQLTPDQVGAIDSRLGMAGSRRIGGRGRSVGATYRRGEFAGKTQSQAIAGMMGQYQRGSATSLKPPAVHSWDEARGVKPSAPAASGPMMGMDGNPNFAQPPAQHSWEEPRTKMGGMPPAPVATGRATPAPSLIGTPNIRRPLKPGRKEILPA